MNRKDFPAALVQLVLTSYVVCAGVLIAMPAMGVAGLVLLGVSSMMTHFRPQGSDKARRFCLWAGWLGSGLTVGSFFLQQRPLPFENYYALMAGMLALAVLLASERLAEADWKRKWRALGVFWVLTGSLLWITAAYERNSVWEFYCALVPMLAGLVLCRVWFRLAGLGIQAVNTFILIFAGLPMADLVLRISSRSEMHSEPQMYYSYADAKAHPLAYARWTQYYGEQWESMGKEIFEDDSTNYPGFQLKPGSTGHLFKSTIVVNSNGFRGPEIPAEKGETYRIVCLGESTTFCCTLRASDVPWPEVLEQMIRERLKPRRPVEVINAGMPAYSLASNLKRISQILAVKPDMIISYHGINGFDMIAQGMPDLVRPAPHYTARPIRLLGDFEYAFVMRDYKRHAISQPPVIAPDNIKPMETDYAKAYEKLIALARTNGIKLVLANYSMAVNRQSPQAVIDFYEETRPGVASAIAANEIHSEIVKRLAAEYPEVCMLDTHSNLDGVHDQYIDLVHFTDGGARQMAENIFAGIRETLEKELAKGDGK